MDTRSIPVGIQNYTPGPELDLEISRADLAPIFATGEMRELMALSPKVVSLRTNRLEDALAFIQNQDRRFPQGLYVGLNPLTVPAGGPDANRPSSGDVASRDALLFDFDGDDPDALRSARNRAQSFLTTQCGFPTFAARRGTSGNGQYLIYQLRDITITPEDDALVHRAVTALRDVIKREFPAVNVDTSVTDLARVRRIAGTVNRKHADAPRLCNLTVHDDQTEPVTRDALEALASLAPATASDAIASGPRPIGTRELDPDQLEEIASAIAPYRKPGNLHNSWRAIAGWAAHTQLSWNTAERLLEAVCVSDQDMKDRQATLRNTYQRYTEGRPVEWRVTSEDVGTSFYAALAKAQAEIRERDYAANADNGTPSFPATDTGNAERLVHRHGANLRYVGLHKAWLVWTGTHWERDETGRVAQLTKDAVRMIKEEAANLSGEEYLKLSKWAHASESATRRAAMELLARSEPGIPARPGDFDQDPWLLTVANGTLDLRTGELRPHSRADMITRYSPIEYRPDAECPLFLEWLHEIMLGRADLVTFLQRAAGYSLTGNVSERVVFILHGGGRNGKTTLLETLSRILGDYAGTAPAEMLLAKRETGIPNDLARLPGRRFVSATETGEGRRLDEVKVKAISGGDTIQARFLHGEWFDFRPSFKIWLGTNHKPEIRGTDNAIWDRIRLIPFDYRVTDDLKIPDLADRFIRDEAAGILAWMVQGCLAWQRDGLGAPAEVMHATSQYRQEMDPLASWIEDRCEISEDATESARALYTSYSTYCEQVGETPLKQRTFGTRLTERGCGSGKSGGTRYRTGIRLLTLEEREKRGEIRPSLENVGHIVSLQKAHNHAENGQDSSNVGHIRTKFQGYSDCDLASRGNPETNVPYAPYVPTEDGKVAF